MKRFLKKLGSLRRRLFSTVVALSTDDFTFPVFTLSTGGSTNLGLLLSFRAKKVPGEGADGAGETMSLSLIALFSYPLSQSVFFLSEFSLQIHGDRDVVLPQQVRNCSVGPVRLIFFLVSLFPPLIVLPAERRARFPFQLRHSALAF